MDQFGFPTDFGFYEGEHPLARLHHDDPERGIVSLAESASKVFDESLAELDRVLTSTNPFAALADFSLYGLLSHHGVDPELRDSHPILQHHVELVQALALRHRASDYTMAPCTPPTFQRLHDLAAQAFDAFTFRSVDWVADPSQSQAELKRRWIQKTLRDDTALLRNWGYATQVFRMLKRLFEPIESAIHARRGFRIAGVIDMFHKLTELRAAVLHDMRTDVRRIQTTASPQEALDVYHSVAPLARRHAIEDTIRAMTDDGMTLKELQQALMVEAIATLHVQLYTFTLGDFVSAYGEDIAPEPMRRVVDTWSLELGGLSATPVERLFLANPIWKRPIIKHGERYFWPILGLFHSFPLEICVPLLEDDAELLRLYEKRRSEFTEEEIHRLFTEAFPGSAVVRNSCWTDPDTLVQYENDLMAVVGDHVFVVEAKAGKLGAAARRGAEKSLERQLGEIVVDARAQAIRFVRHLSARSGRLEFSRRDGGTNVVTIPVDSAFTPLVITFESLGAIGTRSPELEASGFTRAGVPAVPCIALADLEIVFDVLRGPCQKVHYLVRRGELESHLLYMADELDLLAFYLWTGFNIGATEFDGEPITLWGISKCLDHYFTGEHFGVEVKPIRRRLTRWWERLVETVETRRFGSWSVIGTTLLNVSYEDQLEFEQRVRTLVRTRKKGAVGKKLDTIVLHNGPPQRRDMIGAVVYKSLPRDERRRRVSNTAETMLTEESLASVAIAIGVDADGSVLPYDLVAAVKRRKSYPPSEAEATASSG